MWYYKNKKYTELHDSSYVGFCYLITEISTGRKYYGMKHLTSVRTKKLGKKAIAALTDKRLSKKIKTVSESNWLNYNSSSKTLQALIKLNPSNYRKEILSFHKTKKELSYAELKLLVLNDVLLDTNYFNDYISVSKYFRRDFVTVK